MRSIEKIRCHPGMVGHPDFHMNTSNDQASAGPSQCGTRDRAEDAAETVKDMANLLRGMDPAVVRRMVQARDAAAGIFKAFPDGDQRFVDLLSDDEDDEETESTVNEDEESPDGFVGESVGSDLVDRCQGLFDGKFDNGPRACLFRAAEEYGFDAVAAMDEAGLDFFERIRLINFIRKLICDDEPVVEVLRRVRQILATKDSAVLKDDALLEPVLAGDLLLTVLESTDCDDADQAEEMERLSNALEASLRNEKVLS